ncbi:MAG: LuxR family transcriptional regulator [Rhodobacteraceae bacterium]|nr:MAG: LuxR family transcriptional regulator [Paracoccaceae bacterium]
MRRGPPAARPAVIAAVVAAQTLAATFFLADFVADLLRGGSEGALHLAVEGLFAACLAVGVAFGALALRRSLDARRRAESALAVASGAFMTLAQAWFDAWRLTPAEREVALFLLKGLDIGEIARLRGAAEGTVRAQASRVYAKAGVSGRAGLLAFFVEDLIGGATVYGPTRSTPDKPS